MHHTPLIATIAASFVFAFILGMVANRLKFPPIVGYLVAGVVVGPYTPGFIADAALAAELAEIGVILLMFGVGLHFSYKDLFAVRKIAVPGAVVTEADHVIIVGYGRVGRRVADTLFERGVPVVVIESDLERVETLRAAGRSAILGNGVRDEVLRAAGIERAKHLLVAVPNGLESGETVAHARKLNPALRIVARAHLDEEVEHLSASGADRVIMGEREIARQMLADVAPSPA